MSKTPKPHWNRSSNFIGKLGRKAINTLLYWVDLTVFIQQGVRDVFKHESRGNKATYRALISQLIFTGIDAVPVISLLAMALGASITGQIIHLTEGFATKHEIIRMLSYLIIYEIAPLITAVVIIGRSGSAMAVDLGNMKLHGEIEGLELLAIDVNHYFIGPRLVATSISQLVLAIYFAGIALFGGVIFAGMLYSTSYYSYFGEMFFYQNPLLLLLFVFKNLLFGLIIAGTACIHALKVSDSPTQVPQQTQRAIVNGISLIFILNGIIAIASL